MGATSELVEGVKTNWCCTSTTDNATFSATDKEEIQIIY